MRETLKTIADAACAVLMFPAAVLCRLQGTMFGADNSFAGWSQLLALLPGVSGVWLRRAFLRQLGRHCGRDVCVSFGTVFSGRGISLGHGSYVGHFCSLGAVTIEADVLIASHVSIMNGCRQHSTERLDIPIRDQPGVLEPVTIGRDSWIGEHATIAANVGRHCVIGAGALVLEPIPDYAVAVGVPAKVIRDRRDSARDHGVGRCSGVAASGATETTGPSEVFAKLRSAPLASPDVE